MAGLNRVILMGNLGSDPEMRYTASGTAVAKFSVATSRKFTGKDGQKQEKTEWHRIVAWGKLAEICGQYLGKGKQVMIEGRIEYGSYEKDGVKHYTTDIVAENMRCWAAPAAAARTGNRNRPLGRLKAVRRTMISPFREPAATASTPEPTRPRR